MLSVCSSSRVETPSYLSARRKTPSFTPPVKLTAVDLAKLPRRSVQTKDHDGRDTAFEGVDLAEVLKLASVKSGEQLRGKELALFLVVDAADGYRAVFALPELDHAFTNRIILLADRRDGKTIGRKRRTPSHRRS